MFSPKRIFSLVSVVCLALLLLAGCGDPTKPVPRFGPEVADATFNGKWEDSVAGDKFTVDIDNKTFSYTTDPTYDSDYSGEIVGEVLANYDLLKSEYGYLTIKVTNVGNSGYTPAVDSYYVIYWKDLTASSVQEGGAGKLNGNNSGMPTLEEAVAEYTVDTDYFGYLATYTKIP
jgi:hypothetical protein